MACHAQHKHWGGACQWGPFPQRTYAVEIIVSQLYFNKYREIINATGQREGQSEAGGVPGLRAHWVTGVNANPGASDPRALYMSQWDTG